MYASVIYTYTMRRSGRVCLTDLGDVYAVRYGALAFLLFTSRGSVDFLVPESRSATCMIEVNVLPGGYENERWRDTPLTSTHFIRCSEYIWFSFSMLRWES